MALVGPRAVGRVLGRPEAEPLRPASLRLRRLHVDVPALPAGGRARVLARAIQAGDLRGVRRDHPRSTTTRGSSSPSTMAGALRRDVPRDARRSSGSAAAGGARRTTRSRTSRWNGSARSTTACRRSRTVVPAVRVGAPPADAVPAEVPADLLIRGGTRLRRDGRHRAAGRRRRRSSGRIARVAPEPARARRRPRRSTPAASRVAPGFIDLHSHSDFTFPAFPDSPGQVTQGVTSELDRPLRRHAGAARARPRAAPAADRLRARRRARPRLVAGRRSREYMDVLDAARPAVNCLPLVGHNALRIMAMGMAERRPTPAEIETMRAGLREALAAGAWGMSTGLSYAPGQWARTDDIVAVGGAARRAAGALYASHIRNESDELLPAVAEALDDRRAPRASRVEVSHLKAAGPPQLRADARRARPHRGGARARRRGPPATCTRTRPARRTSRSSSRRGSSTAASSGCSSGSARPTSARASATTSSTACPAGATC